MGYGRSVDDDGVGYGSRGTVEVCRGGTGGREEGGEHGVMVGSGL